MQTVHHKPPRHPLQCRAHYSASRSNLSQRVLQRAHASRHDPVRLDASLCRSSAFLVRNDDECLGHVRARDDPDVLSILPCDPGWLGVEEFK